MDKLLPIAIPKRRCANTKVLPGDMYQEACTQDLEPSQPESDKESYIGGRMKVVL